MKSQINRGFVQGWVLSLTGGRGVNSSQRGLTILHATSKMLTLWDAIPAIAISICCMRQLTKNVFL